MSPRHTQQLSAQGCVVPSTAELLGLTEGSAVVAGRPGWVCAGLAWILGVRTSCMSSTGGSTQQNQAGLPLDCSMKHHEDCLHLS